ncbi:MAG: GlcG/HbpS family heme-binding protein, partial [Burkholderiaceae bacterium]
MKKILLATSLMFAALPALAQSGTFAARLLTPETALKATRAALEECRKRGFQVAVAVVDRSGVAQAMLRDRFAGPHTVYTAINKGYTAI